MLTWMQDARDTVRGLRRAAGFSVLALGMLAIALTANAVVFSTVNAIARPELPYHDRARIVSITEIYAPYGWRDVPTSLATVADLRRASAFSAVAAHSQRRVSYADGAGAPARLQAAVVSANIWHTLGVSPILGRGFIDADDQPGHRHPVVIGYRLWRDRYNLEPDVLNRTAAVDGVLRPIVGVMPDGFRFPETEDLWLPLGLAIEADRGALQTRDTRAWRVVARLQQDTTLERATGELRLLSGRLAEAYPDTNAHWTLTAVPVSRESLLSAGPFFGALLAGALLLVLVTCGNLGNLLLARSEQRRRELAIRVSLGAPHRRLVWLLILEPVLLSALAAAIALVLAASSLRILPAAIPESIPFFIRFRIDAVVAAFTALLALIMGVGAGLASAFRVPTRDTGEILTRGAATLAGTPAAGRLRSLFLFVQTAVAAALLASTLVVAAGLIQFRQMDLGFDPANTVLVELPLPRAGFENHDTIRAFASRVVDRVDRLPEVGAVAISAPVPLAADAGTNRAIETDASGSLHRDEQTVIAVSVTPQFFRAAGMRILAGRGVSSTDVASGESVAVLNEEAARRFFGATDVLGRRIRFGREPDARPWRTVVGVVPNIIVQPLDPEIEPRIYVPYDQEPARLLTLTVRSAGRPERIAPVVSRALTEIDPHLAHEAPITAERRLAVALWPLRFFNGFAAGLAVFGLVVAASGVYGLTMYLTLARTREIGLRLALGATPAAIVGLIVRQTGRAVAAGTAVGLVASLAIANLLQHILAGVAPVNPLTLAATAGVLLAAGALAVVIPAVHATRIEPVQALRRE